MAPYTRRPVNSNNAKSPTAFLEFSSEIKQNHQNLGQKFMHYLHRVSFKDMGDSGPFFVWASEPDLLFNEKTNIDTSDMDK